MTEQAEKQNLDKVIKEIKIKLTTDEIVSKAQAAAQLSQEVSDLDDELSEHKSRIKNMVEPKEAAIRQHLEIINAGVETRMVECELRYDYELGIVEYIFEGVVVESRNMDSDDRQMTLVKTESAVGMQSQDEELRDIIKSEMSTKTKVDMITTDAIQSDDELDPMAREFSL